MFPRKMKMKFIESQDNRKQDRASVKAELRDKVEKELYYLKKFFFKCQGSVIAILKFLFEIE